MSDGQGSPAPVEIWFNPRCSKCRIARDALDEAGLTYNLRYYLEEPPSAAELTEVLARLELQPWDVVRFADAAKAGVDTDLPRDEAHRGDWLALLVANPQLLQRPLVVTDDGEAWVARDPDSVDAIVRELS